MLYDNLYSKDMNIKNEKQQAYLSDQMANSFPDGSVK